MGRFFFEFEAVRASRGRFSRSTGETSSTAPESGRRRYCVVVGRQPTPVRHRRAPGRLGQPRGPRAVPRRPRTGAVGVVALRSVRTASNSSERSTSTPSTRRVRRRAKPRLCWLQRHAVRAALLVKQSGIASWHICDVLPAPLRFRRDRCGSVARLLSPLRESKLFQQRQMLRNIAFVSIQAKRRPTHAAWAASMRAESKTRRRHGAQLHTPLLALLQP